MREVYSAMKRCGYTIHDLHDLPSELPQIFNPQSRIICGKPPTNRQTQRKRIDMFFPPSFFAILRSQHQNIVITTT